MTHDFETRIVESDTVTLHTEVAIDSSHQLIGYDGACSRLHGHTWFLEIWVRGSIKKLNKDGILFDFGNVKKIKDKYDHQLLNLISPFDNINPTAENLTYTIYSDLKKENEHLQFCIKLFETKVGKETWCMIGDFTNV